MKKLCLVLVFFLFSFQLLAEEEKWRIAVMEVEDKTAKIPEKTLEAATDYLRIAFTSTTKYVVISQSRQKEKIAEIRKEYNTNPTYKSCTDRACWIQLGEALSAQLIVQTSINRFANIYIISSELTDLESDSSEIAAKADFDGSEESMKEALDSIAEKITAAYQKQIEKEKEEEKQRLKEEKRREEEQKKLAEKKRREEQEQKRLAEERRREEQEQKRLAEEIRHKEEQEQKRLAEEKRKEDEAKKIVANKKREINAYKYTGMSFILAGAAILGGGIGGFTVDYKKERDNYNKMISSELIKAGVSSGMTKEDYVKKANKYRKNANTSRNMIFASGAVGAAFVIIGSVLVDVGLTKEWEWKEHNKQTALNNFSVIPMEKGFYASLGFDF